jgi:putative tryptophan/tyrosine transport system substrate-binding protein
MRLGHAVVAVRPPRSAHSTPDPSMPDSGIVPESPPVECIATPCFSWSRRLALLMPPAIRPHWSSGGSVRRRPSWTALSRVRIPVRPVFSEEAGHGDRSIDAPGGPRPRGDLVVDRRGFIRTVAGGLLTTPLAAEAQQLGKPYRIGVLERTSTAVNAANVNAFRQGLRERGYVEGERFVIEYRSADGRDAQFPVLAAELVQLKVDLILTRGTPAALAARNATATIPVVFTGVGDPVGQGIVASLAHPGRNITGLSAAVTEIFPKRVQLIRELVPKAARIAALFNMSNPALPSQWREVERAARSLGVEANLLDVRKAEDLVPAFDAATRQRADALVVGLDTLTQANQQLIVDLAAKRRLPAIYASMEFAGGLAVYGVNYPEMYRQAASFADKIFKGAKPADLPVEEPTKVELVINLKTANALGLTIPQSVLFRADHVIE